MRMVLFAISSKLIFTHFIYHTLLFIIPSSFPSYFNSITFITTHPCFSFTFAFMFFMHPLPSHSFSQPLQSHSLLSISIQFLSFHSISSFPFICYFSFDSSFSCVLWYPALRYPPLSFISSKPLLIPPFHPLHPVHIVSSLLIFVSLL